MMCEFEEFEGFLFQDARAGHCISCRREIPKNLSVCDICHPPICGESCPALVKAGGDAARNGRI